MKIMIWSTAPWIKTGYGKNCAYLTRALKTLGHEICVLVTYGHVGGVLNSHGVKILPANNNFWHMGEAVKYWEEKEMPDLIIQHFDLWVVQPNFIENYDIQTPLVTYMPVDSSPMPHVTKESANGAYDNIAMSKFAQDAFLANNMPSKMIIPHTVDTSVYHPVLGAKSLLGLPEDKFIIGSVATNKGPRKNIGGQLLAFSKALERWPEMRETCAFYLHTYMSRNEYNPEGFDLPQMIKNLEIENNIAYTDQIEYFYGLNEEDMKILFSAFDLLTECSYGEGFGIPIIEAQACGTPVVGTDFSAIPEVIGEGGSLISPSETIFFQVMGIQHKIPNTDVLAEIYHEYFVNKQFREEKGKKALENAQKFNFEIWRENWKTYMEKL